MPEIDMDNTVAYAQKGMVTESGSYFVAYVTRDEPGYYRTTYEYSDFAAAKACAENINEQRGFTAEQVSEIVASSFRASN